MFESLLFAVLVLLLEGSVASAQAIPERYSISSGTVVSSNGSSSTGGCNTFTSTSFSSNCQVDDTGGVIFDGLVPNLTASDFQGNKWARGLLTILTDPSGGTELRLDFSAPISVEDVEIVMFNCPEWEVSVDSVRTFGARRQNLSLPTSCDSLVSFCLPVNSRDWPRVQIQFMQGSNSDWIHIAEVKVIERGSSLFCSQPRQIIVPRLSTVSSEVPRETSTRPVQDEGNNNNSTGSCGGEASPSNHQTIILASVISALAAIILCSVFFSVLLMAICKYHPRFRGKCTKMDELIKSRNVSPRNSAGSQRSADNAASCQETGVGEASNEVSDNRYLRASEIVNDSITSRMAKDVGESCASGRAREDYSYENTRGIYLEVDDVVTRDSDIKLFKNQSYCANALQQQLPPQTSIRLVANQSYGFGNAKH